MHFNDLKIFKRTSAHQDLSCFEPNLPRRRRLFVAYTLFSHLFSRKTTLTLLQGENFAKHEIVITFAVAGHANLQGYFVSGCWVLCFR